MRNISAATPFIYCCFLFMINNISYTGVCRHLRQPQETMLNWSLCGCTAMIPCLSKCVSFSPEIIVVFAATAKVFWQDNGDSFLLRDIQRTDEMTKSTQPCLGTSVHLWMTGVMAASLLWDWVSLPSGITTCPRNAMKNHTESRWVKIACVWGASSQNWGTP